MIRCPHCQGQLSADSSDYKLIPTIEAAIDKMGLAELRRDYKITFANQQKAEANYVRMRSELAGFKRFLDDCADV